MSDMTMDIMLGAVFLLLFGFVGIVGKLNKTSDVMLPPIYRSQVVQGLVSLFAILALGYLVFLFFWSWKLALIALAVGVATLARLLVPLTERFILLPLVRLLSRSGVEK